MIRKARVQDVTEIRDLINACAEKGAAMLRRPLGVIYDNLRDFHVYVKDGKVAGAAAIHIGWEGLAELRSVAVAPEYIGRGVGRELVNACLQEARELGIPELFVLTDIPGFFEKLGFKLAEKEDLPQKIWTECRKLCVKYPDQCNETALTLALDS